FFSSRRRHTRSYGDWSSDVCSSDLLPGVERHELRRGDALVAAGAYTSSYRLDVALDELDDIPARVHVHHGTAAVVARVARAGDQIGRASCRERGEGADGAGARNEQA